MTDQYFLTEDVNLTEDLAADEIIDIVSVMFTKKGAQTVYGMDKIARGDAAAYLATKDKGMSVWWAVPEVYAVPTFDPPPGPSESVNGYRFWADGDRKHLHRLNKAVIVCEKMVEEEVNLVASTRRSGDFGKGVSPQGGRDGALDAHFYTVDRHPSVVRKLKTTSDRGASYDDPLKMLRARAKNGYVYKTSLTDELRRPCFGNIVMDNPLYNDKETPNTTDNPLKKFTLLPHIHLVDVQWHFDDVNQNTGTAYPATEPIMRFTIGVFYSASQFPDAGGLKLVNIPSPYRLMKLDRYEDVYDLDGFILGCQQTNTAKMRSKKGRQVNEVVMQVVKAQTGLPVYRQPPPPGVVYTNRTAGFGPHMAPLDTVGWHFYDKTGVYGNDEGLIETGENGPYKKNSSFQMVQSEGEYQLGVVLTGLPLGGGGYKVIRLGGEGEPSIFSLAVQGPPGPVQGMGGYASHNAYYGKTCNQYKWNQGVGETGGYELYDFEQGKPVTFTDWPWFESKMQSCPVNTPFIRYDERGNTSGGLHATSLVGDPDGRLHKKNGVVGIAEEISQEALGEAQQHEVVDVVFFTTAIAILSCVTEVLGIISNAMGSHKGEEARVKVVKSSKKEGEKGKKPAVKKTNGVKAKAKT